MIQIAMCKKQFDLATEALFRHYQENTNPSKINEFLEYFRKQYIDKHNGWWEGYAENLPSTNNGEVIMNIEMKTVMNRTPNPFLQRHANSKTTLKYHVTPRSDIVGTRCRDIPNSHHVSRTTRRVHLLWSLTTRRMYQHRL
jgi:hypothetical protein